MTLGRARYSKDTTLMQLSQSKQCKSSEAIQILRLPRAVVLKLFEKFFIPVLQLDLYLLLASNNKYYYIFINNNIANNEYFKLSNHINAMGVSGYRLLIFFSWLSYWFTLDLK